jgi:hypothetical protein
VAHPVSNKNTIPNEMKNRGFRHFFENLLFRIVVFMLPVSSALAYFPIRLCGIYSFGEKNKNAHSNATDVRMMRYIVYAGITQIRSRSGTCTVPLSAKLH